MTRAWTWAGTPLSWPRTLILRAMPPELRVLGASLSSLLCWCCCIISFLSTFILRLEIIPWADEGGAEVMVKRGLWLEILRAENKGDLVTDGLWSLMPVWERKQGGRDSREGEPEDQCQRAASSSLLLVVLCGAMPCLVARCLWLIATPWTVAYQAPLSMGILQARILEGTAMPSSRGIFPTQGLNPGPLHWRQILYHLSHQESP